MFFKSWRATLLRFESFVPSTLLSIYWRSFLFHKFRWNKVATQASKIKYTEEQSVNWRFMFEQIHIKKKSKGFKDFTLTNYQVININT